MAASRFLLPFLFVLVAGGSALASVEETCAKATAGGSRKDLQSFCVTSLQAAPRSASADAHGLASIATNLTLANYTEAVATIKALQRRGGWSKGATAALAACRQGYIQAQNVVHSAVHALATGNKTAYVADMGVVRKAATDCGDSFKSGGSSVAAESPLRKVNQDAADLATVSILIVNSL